MKILQSVQKWLLVAFAVITIPVLADTAFAGKPEYMKMDLSPGNTFEIKGYWDESGVLVATDITALPKKRRPRLRGVLQDIDYNRHTITMYGMHIKVSRKTQFVDDGSGKAVFDSLKVKQRLEVTCKVDSAGNWKARKIKIKGIKPSNKIKATITRSSVDGNPPDTIEVSGLLIILNNKTDADDPHSFIGRVEHDIFGDLARRGTAGFADGIIMGGEHTVEGEYRQNYRGEREFALSETLKSDRDESLSEVRLKLSSFWSNKVQSYAQLRIRKDFIISSSNQIITNGSNDTLGAFQAQFIQLYFVFRNLGVKGLSFKIGRQDMDDQREWLYDEYLDAATIYYYGLSSFLFQGSYIHEVTPLKIKSQTWTDVLLRATWYYDENNSLSGYILSRKDSDVRKREPIWYGLSANGYLLNGFRPWANVAIMRGNDKRKPVDAWAVDAGATFTATNLRLSPSVTLGYAVGSGDDNRSDATDHRFRQSGYQDNYTTLGGISVRYYGALFDPELSNIRITTAAASIRPTHDSSVEVAYHTYKQHKVNQTIKGSNLAVEPLGGDTHLGSAIDLVVGLKNIWWNLRGSWTLALFNPGVAFEPIFTKSALLSKVNLTWAL